MHHRYRRHLAGRRHGDASLRIGLYYDFFFPTHPHFCFGSYPLPLLSHFCTIIDSFMKFLMLSPMLAHSCIYLLKNVSPIVSGILHLISYPFTSSPTTIVCIAPQRSPPETKFVFPPTSCASCIFWSLTLFDFPRTLSTCITFSVISLHHHHNFIMI